MLPKDEVLAGLKQSLTLFGNIIDVGIAAEPNTGLFMGIRYAVLNVEQAANKENKFLELSHQLSWCESESEVFHATWQNMPTWCRYCHKEGHTKFDCPLSKARIICYSCHQQGHRSFECPRRRNVPTNLHNQISNPETQQEKITINTITIESEDESND
jgi:hypothetical protein